MSKLQDKKQATIKIVQNIDDLLNAVAMSTTTIFAGYSAYTHRGNGILWILLGVASAWSVLQAFTAWSKVLNK
jgi:hypothetical protein